MDYGQDKWDVRFLKLARHIAGWSKDPSTKVGAVLVDDKNRVRGMGYNGFPRRVDDNPILYLPDANGSKQQKYERVVHAELNAILEAKNCEGLVLYTTMFTCNECAKAVIQSGVNEVISPKPNNDGWDRAHKVAHEMYIQAGVRVRFIEEDAA